MIIWEKILEQFAYIPKEPMIFSSGFFLYLFLGFSLIYCLLKKKDTARILFVTAFSYYFYYKSSGIYFVLLAIVTLCDFYIAQKIHAIKQEEDDEDGERKAKYLLFLSLLIDLGLLAYFKYTNFLDEIICSIISTDPHHWEIFLPVGISFFTFQSMSYTIDVYRGQLKPLDRVLDYAFYVSFFPQLVAGPIVRATDFIPQIRKPLMVTQEMFGRGVFFILAGLFKKCIISDYIGANFVDRIFDSPELYNGFENLFAVYGYCIQIYGDFSGYSDMAIGIALLLGFKFPPNFKAPYKAFSIGDFWRRWHMSLSHWLRDYVYISLGGGRCSKWRQYMNLFITFFLCGLWHGASFNFVLFGILQGLAVIGEKALLAWQKRPKHWEPTGFQYWLAVFLNMHFVCMCWIVFRSQDFAHMQSMVITIFTNFNIQGIGQWIAEYWPVASLIILGFVLHYLPTSWNEKTERIITRMPIYCQALCFLIIVWGIVQVKSADVLPFIYFQF